jgi:Ca-activated chloride channel family protein
MGRHQHRSRRFDRISREPAVLATIVVAALAGSFAAVRLVGSAPAPAASACPTDTHTISVAAETSVVPWLTDLGNHYNEAHHEINGTCLRVAVREMTPLQAIEALQPVPFPGGGKPPQVWVPESSAAVAIARARPENRAVLAVPTPSIASSPIVVAAPADAVRALEANAPNGRGPGLGTYLQAARDPQGWGQSGVGHPEWGKLLFSTADPSKTTLGASLLLLAAGAVSNTPADQVGKATFLAPRTKAGLLAFVRATARIAPSAQELLSTADDTPSTREMLASYGLVGTWEQEVWRYNQGKPAVLLDATYPVGGELAADFPFVVPNASWVSALDKRAAADFHTWLTSAPVQGRLGMYGLRRADGSTTPALTDNGLDTSPQTPRAVKNPEGPATAQAVWRLLNRRVGVLALLDVSGSMADPVPGTNLSKLQVAVAAARNSLGLFDDRDQIGLWEFSTKIDGNRDYRELIPLGLAAGKVNGVDRRVASAKAQSQLVPLRGTGLYDSIAAAYRNAQANYLPGYVTSVVVITDGRNEDPGSITLGALIKQLRSEFSPEKPVHIVTIAYGKDADGPTLAKIAKSVDGLSFNAPDPRQIGEVFINAVAALTD